MKNKKVYLSKIGVLLWLILGFALNLEGQKVYIPDTPLEGFELTTDRDLYVTGETIWFSVKNSHISKPGDTPLSKIIYVELFDADNKIIQRGKFTIQDNCAKGQFMIPQEQPSGIYYLRAYTQYLKNFHPNTHPIKILTILNPSVPIVKSDIREEDKLKCFAEGGKLIAGLLASVAITIPEKTIEKIQSVSLISGDTAIIIDIKFFANGLGYFEFTPELNNRYTIQTVMQAGDSMITPLPPVEASGFACQIKEEGDRIIYKVLQNSKSPFTQNRKYHLHVSTQKFASVFMDSVRGASPVVQFKMNKKILGHGINYFTLLDGDKKIVDIKAHYNFPSVPYSVSIQPDKLKYESREKINLNIEIPEILASDTIHVSLAIVTKGSIYPADELLPSWIANQPWLIQPDIFLEQTLSPGMMMQVKAAMILYQKQLIENTELHDELMDNIKELKYIPEIRNVSISGYIKDSQTDNPKSGSTVFLSYVGGNTRVHVSETQPDGSFIFPLSPYHEARDFFLCTFDENPDQEILINSDYFTEFPILSEIPLIIDSSNRRLIEELYINRQFHDLWINKYPQDITIEESFQLGFGTPDISIRLEDYIDLSSMEVVLNEIVPFVKVRKRKGNYKITILDSETGLSYENYLLLVDNIPLDNTNDLMQIHPANVEQIDVINRTYVIGDHTFQGILLVKTKTENFGGITIPGDAVFIKYPLLSDSFLFPYFNHETQQDQKLQTDFRNVLYWNPDILLTKDRTISFFASDNLSDYEIIIQGRTLKGEVVYGKGQLKIAKD